MSKRISTLLLALVMAFSLAACSTVDNDTGNRQVIFTDDTSSENNTEENTVESVTTDEIIETILEYSGEPWVIINDNKPNFTSEDSTDFGTEIYSPLDDLGRCGVAYAVIGIDTMPTEDRGNISSVKPTGWHSNAAANWNRCHLIGFQLAGENANELNLITGTRYLNIDGMLPFENMVADYVKETNNHVMYKVTPVYTGNNLVADGVYMEAYSIEDSGEGIEFNVYCFNVAPGVVIDYLTGDSYEEGSSSDESKSTGTGLLPSTGNVEISTSNTDRTYILNTSSLKIHDERCSSVAKISDTNKQTYTGNIEDLLNSGYTICGICDPE